MPVSIELRLFSIYSVYFCKSINAEREHEHTQNDQVSEAVNGLHFVVESYFPQHTTFQALTKKYQFYLFETISRIQAL